MRRIAEVKSNNKSAVIVYEKLPAKADFRNTDDTD